MQPSEVKTKEDLVVFIQELLKDFQENKENWENITLERYLETLAAYFNDINGFYANQGRTIPEQPDWEMIAVALKGASMYE